MLHLHYSNRISSLPPQLKLWYQFPRQLNRRWPVPSPTPLGKHVPLIKDSAHVHYVCTCTLYTRPLPYIEHTMWELTNHPPLVVLLVYPAVANYCQELPYAYWHQYFKATGRLTGSKLGWSPQSKYRPVHHAQTDTNNGWIRCKRWQVFHIINFTIIILRPIFLDCYS